MRSARPGAGRVAGLVTAVACLSMGVGTPVSAQAPATPEPRLGCFRGRPLPACRSLWIVEMQASTPLVQSERRFEVADGSRAPEASFESVVEWNLGHMVNVGPGLAFGGVVTLGSGSDGPLTGVKLRARRWLSTGASLELEVGAVRTTARHNRYPAVSGATADLRVNARDLGAFYVRWDGVALPGETFSAMGYRDPGGFQQALSLGVGLGSVPALVGSGVAGLLVFGLIMALAGSPD